MKPLHVTAAAFHGLLSLMGTLKQASHGLQCDFRFDLSFSFSVSFSLASYFLVLVSFQFYQTC